MQCSTQFGRWTFVAQWVYIWCLLLKLFLKKWTEILVGKVMTDWCQAWCLCVAVCGIVWESCVQTCQKLPLYRLSVALIRSGCLSQKAGQQSDEFLANCDTTKLKVIGSGLVWCWAEQKKKRGSVHQFKIWKGPTLRPAASCRSSCSLLLCHLRPLAVTSSECLEISDTVNMPGWSFPS